MATGWFGDSTTDNEGTPLTGGAAKLAGIHDEELRRGFVSKVYGILVVQLLATALVGYTIMVNGQDLLQEKPDLVFIAVWISLVLTVSVSCVFACCTTVARTFPTNYVLLAIFTLAESFLVGFICLGLTQESVLVVLGITAAVVGALTILAVCTRIDFTGAAPYLCCACMVLVGFCTCLIIASQIRLGSSPGEYKDQSPAWETAHLVYATMAALLFSAYIVYDTQMILGGKDHAFEYSLDDYALAALQIYIDIIQIFLHLLTIFGDRD